MDAVQELTFGEMLSLIKEDDHGIYCRTVGYRSGVLKEIPYPSMMVAYAASMEEPSIDITDLL